MKAARAFSYGDGETSHVFAVGDEVPDDIAEDIPDDLLLEKLAQDDPNKLTREQLLVLAGIEEDPDEYEFDEDEFREGLAQFTTKRELVDWANEVYGASLNQDSANRDELEDMIVELASS